jgi:ribosomal protein S18
MKILSGKRTGVCSWHQRKLTTAVKRARIVALLAATHK